MMLRKNGGFTLVELMVTILVSTLVTAAAVTALLFGLRLNNQSSHVQTQQNTTRILLAILEDMASEGTIGQVDNNYSSWEIRGEMPDDATDGPLLLRYADGAIQTASGEILMDGIFSSEASYDNKLLTIQIETDTGIFSSTVHCKMDNITETGEAATPDDLEEKAEEALAGLAETKEARLALLNILSAQRGNGAFCFEGTSEVYYSQWYITTKEGTSSWGANGWNESTPWCACFVSWGLNQIKDKLDAPADRVKGEEPFWYANVDEFYQYFYNQGTAAWCEMYFNSSAPLPAPGDVIFFDRAVYDGVVNPDHVGVVFHVDTEEKTIYTIEGNSMGKVAIRAYSSDNKTILGYGVLPWKGDAAE